ncbi:histidine utilization repressor [Rhizobium sp. SSA_523]|uniref:histidine utilization repressor n=1 Tax=Rhizobium sp. SSA_523 TaxID=2952477 RepID=UPI002090710A|nr:histidine utilization repressor [Rhizobium sp. SSA_523]MCO5731236.1 histidine utilization repressor [Rhizobium sp. SSA_523]WKC22226.1 histidine utilization repressor [Rhizobium sp. SSA_523]
MQQQSKSRSTLHQTILGELEQKIVSGEWPPGHKLPFELDLAKTYNVSRMTVNKVMTQLVKAGLIERRKRSGSFVAQPKGQSAILEINDIESEVRALGQSYAFSILSKAMRPMHEIDTADWDVPGTARILVLTCLHQAGGVPFCLEERLINLDVVPEASSAAFETEPPGNWLIRQAPWSTAEHRIFAVNATDRLPALLQIPKGSACLIVERRTWSEVGPVTHVRLTYPGKQHAIVARFSPASKPA